MGYNPDIPSTWSIKQLLEYARQRGIDVPSGCEKSELVTIVDEYLTDELLAEHIRSESALDTDVIGDIVAASTASILRHVAHPSYTSVLRRHPAKLQAIIEAGIEQLQSLPFVARLCSARVHSPVQAWLGTLASDCGDGKHLLTVLKAPNSDVAASPVCGRFCGEQEMVVRCLDCGADSTCVMCMDCFRHSPCVNHRYRITQSSGGGMCDCGDPTAWKLESFCSRHRAAAAAAATGDGNSASDPLDTMAEDDRVWAVPVLRGIIQFTAVTLLQHTRLQVLQKRVQSRAGKQRRPTSGAGNSTASGSGTGTAGSAATARVSDAEAALLNDVARISDKFDWLEEWMSEVTRQLWELIQASDIAKRLVAQLWAEPVRMAMSGRPGAVVTAVHDNEEEARGEEAGTAASMADPVLDALPPNFTCVHMVFLHEASRPMTAREQPLNATSRSAPWLNNLLRCVGHCLSDAKFRFPVGGLMATYAEYINAQERAEDKNECLSQYQVQVLTNPDVIRHLMTPSHLPYKAATNTVLHRELSALLYALWLARDTVSGASANPVTETAALSRDGLLFVAHQAAPVSLASVTALQSCLSGSPAACYTLVLNRLAWRAFVQIAGTLAISGYIYKDPDAPTDSQHYPTPDFIARCISRHMWLWVHAIRVVLSCLLRLPVTAATDSSASMPALSHDAIAEALGVTTELWETWRGATAFDTPPDRLRQKGPLLEMLSACRVANGRDEALLLVEHGPMAAAQSRALGKQQLAEQAGTPKNAKTNVLAAPALATAMGYTIQALYEISRTMDVVFEKQRDGFCRRCRSIVLERKTPTGLPRSRQAASHRGTSQNEEAHDTDAPAGAGLQAPSPPRGAAQPRPVRFPSTCSVDIVDYTLLEPHAHATTFSSHLPRLFGAVLTAWVIENQRATSRLQSAASSSSAAPAEVLATTRISGLPTASANSTAPTGETSGLQGTPAHVHRPLRSLLDAFFQVRAEVTRNEQDRLTFSQQLLDSLVMPHVLTGQVVDGLWRRGDYDVSSAVTMYLTFSRGVSAEFDILMMQVLTMELAPADMALQILQRFSYAKRRLRDADTEHATQAQWRRASALHGQQTAEQLPEKPLDVLPTMLAARRPFFRRCLDGYKHLLRLILTIVTDVSKAAFQAPMSSPVIDRIVGGLLAHGKASHSSIVANVNGTARGGDYGDADEDEKDPSGNVIKFSMLIDAAIRKLAVAEDSAQGKQFRLKDVDVWRTHVGLYHIGVVDSHLEEFYKTYRGLVSAADAAKQKQAESHALAEGDDATGGGGQQQQQKRISLPPTQLPDTNMYAELVPTTRALLHTDAVLLPALYVLHVYASYHVPVAVAATSDAKVALAQKEGTTSTAASAQESPLSRHNNAMHEGADDGREDTESGSDDDGHSDDREDANVITREALLHATTTLYLCVQDCVSITRAMRAIEGYSGETASATEKGVISWDLLELYLRRFPINEPSFTHASCAQWLPLPELVPCQTLLEKLKTPVQLHTHPSNGTSTVTTTSSADMLHRLRGYLLSNKDADPYGCLEMVEAVLVQTGLATFNTADLLDEQKTKDEAAQSRKKVIQERQAMLMQRMRSRALKASEKMKAAATAAQQQEGQRGSDEASGPAASPSEKSPTGGVVGSLLAKLLLELTTLDCCVCCSATEEPLFLLCHTGTSGVLPQLGAISLPDGRHVHSHLSMCGHAAHKSCVEKVFVRLSVLWQRWNFRSQFYLGPTEFNCPLCTTIITALCPMPVLPGGGNGDLTAPTSRITRMLSSAATTPFASLFEELQNGTVSASNQPAVDVAAEFHITLANAAVGFSPSEDVPAIVSAEDELQQKNEAAWQLSEAIRAFCYACHLQLEAVKAGQELGHRDLIGLLSVLVSIMPAELERQQVDLRSNYARNMPDNESLLVMDALLQPRDASRLITAHVLTQVLPSMPANFVARLVAVACARCKDDNDEGAHAAAASLEEEFTGVTVDLWQTVGVLTLLKALVVEDAHHGVVLRSSTFTVAGAVTFSVLSGASVRTPASRCTSILRMLQYLLPVPHKSTEAELQVVAQDIFACTQAATTPGTPSCSGHGMEIVKSAMPYTTPEEWVAQIAEKLLHLPSVYTTVLTRFAEHKLCTICHQEPMKPVVCCRCGKLMCMQPPSSPPELYTHTRTCGGAIGIFLVVRTANFYVLELTSGRVYHYPSNYTDEYGEHDRNLRRGIPLFRNTEETQKLVLTWMLNRWGAVSSIFGVSNRMDLSTL
ncbi:putative ubiquitin ligase [Leishmania mexicana MHOM/GT/2001/U1103]|uniref:E3 ubiquitin-protein ligase n=1 Tax=Leishmania mexicana (strain MHOM/GT/2001/U1103) TaxID=929439 RepID=E9AMS5_LEIMU|nr:putative ubiquitin ligase [Leishmania mexicana MHOM/GT/2001/U1103]CBZ24230.1 putative ubiquitin ligase [Leishmania mexicana MHOM/GT/2001/U1103]